MNSNTATSQTLEPETTAIRPQLYTLEEAASLLRRKPNWLYAKTRDRLVPHRRFGKFIAFTQTDIEAIIAMSLRGPAEAEPGRLS
ncbi:MAG: helix-turn-helix domain-containing protein [Acidobacteria bacterium]|nr:helix-turn-helix domain-containing protein [Acidobacteriota bacterium]